MRAMPTRQDLDPSPALSIIENGPERFEGRKLGILVTDGADAALLKALQTALEKEGAVIEIIAPKVGGVKASDGSWIAGEPDDRRRAVGAFRRRGAAPLGGRDGRSAAGSGGARFRRRRLRSLQVHRLCRSGEALFEKAGIADSLDEGVIALDGRGGAAKFVAALGDLRLWGREPNVKMP